VSRIEDAGKSKILALLYLVWYNINIYSIIDKKILFDTHLTMRGYKK